MVVPGSLLTVKSIHRGKAGCLSAASTDAGATSGSNTIRRSLPAKTFAKLLFPALAKPTISTLIPLLRTWCRCWTTCFTPFCVVDDTAKIELLPSVPTVSTIDAIIFSASAAGGNRSILVTHTSNVMFSSAWKERTACCHIPRLKSIGSTISKTLRGTPPCTASLTNELTAPVPSKTLLLPSKEPSFLDDSWWAP